jgi:GT2 family glycosyltransferase
MTGKIAAIISERNQTIFIVIRAKTKKLISQGRQSDPVLFYARPEKQFSFNSHCYTELERIAFSEGIPSWHKEFSRNAAVIVADNASTDESLTWLQQQHPDVQVIQMESNTGFAGGYNRALQKVKADIYVLLNSDVLVTENWLPPILDLMQSDTTIAACQPKIRSYTDRNLLEHAGGSGGFIDHLGYPFCRGRIYNTLEEDKGQYNERREIFWATGACLFIRSEVFHACKGFDEDFFAHMEEIDLCWRIHHRGYKIMVEPSSVIYHVGGGTLPRSNPRKTYYNFRNNMLMLHKNLLPGKWRKVFLIRLLMDGLAGVKFLLSGHPADCASVIKAHFYFYSNYSRRKKIRKEEQEKITHRDIPGIYNSSIVFDYYISGKKYFSQLKGDFSGNKK